MSQDLDDKKQRPRVPVLVNPRTWSIFDPAEQNLFHAYRTVAKQALFRIYEWTGRFLPTQRLQSRGCDYPATRGIIGRGVPGGTARCAESSEEAQGPSSCDEQGRAPGGQRACRESSGRTWALPTALG